jgi:KaiC/GvpD/RAD55 family RecA-like ATPase
VFSSRFFGNAALLSRERDRAVALPDVRSRLPALCAQHYPEHDTILILIAVIGLLAIMEVAGMSSVASESSVPGMSPVTGTSSVTEMSPSSGRVRKRSTGIVGLNLLLDGGFPEGTMIMIHGTAVAGLELAARHFCHDHPDETGSYVVPEEFIESAGTAAKMNPALLLQKMTGMRIVVDSLSDVIERYGIEQALFLVSLAKEDLKKNNSNLMFIVYADVHSPMDMARIMRASDIVIEFKTDIHQAEIERTLAVHKIKDAAAPQRLLPFIITDHGIEASTTSRVV